MVNNNNRYDLSERLIHFFRDVDTDTDDAPPTPEWWSYSSVQEDTFLPAEFLLRHAIRQGRLWATWSIRRGKRTIYGLRPAVCFTEMPIPAFIEASQSRAAKGEAMSSYALVFPKPATFKAGARPVIYGLSGDAWASGGADGGPRIFNEGTLPLAEQFRYVAYDPTKRSLDWTHEREWRWPLDQKPWENDGSPPSESDDLPGLNIDHPSLQGLGVIVHTATSAQHVVFDILTKVDRGDISEDQYQFVLADETIPNWKDLRDPADLDQVISDNLVTLDPYFRADYIGAGSIIDELSDAVERRSPPPGHDGSPERGGCWLWLLDNRVPFVRALVKTGRAKVSKSGKYLVEVSRFNATRSLRDREEMTKILSVDLLHNFGIRANYFSVLEKFDPDEVPFYNGDELDDRFFYNCNWS